MAASGSGSLPRLSAGSLDGLLACPRRLADHLAPEGERPSRARQHDGPFRLRNWVRSTLYDAHRAADHDGVPVGDRLDVEAPASLSVEERAAFARVIEAYADAHGDDGATLVELGLDTLESEGPGGSHLLTGQPFLVVRTADGELELRTIHLGSDPRHRIGDGPGTGDVVNARLILRSLGMPVPRAAGDRLVRVARLAIRPTAVVWHTEVCVDDLDRLRSRVLAAVVEATDARRLGPDRAPTRVGWWCTDCASLRGCPAVPQEQLTDLVDRITGPQ